MRVDGFHLELVEQHRYINAIENIPVIDGRSFEKGTINCEFRVGA
jgi:hypothetical protein